MSKHEYLKRTIIKENIYSGKLQEDRSFRVYLPPEYHELISYPVLYTQDGQDAFMYGRIATIANKLILDHGVEPFIIVGIDVDKKQRTSEYSTIGEKNEAYKAFIVDELLPFMEEHYPVKKGRQNTVLMGDSLGGTVSLDLAVEHPDLFSKVLSLSGAYFEPSFNHIQSYNQLSHLDVWMLIGTEETAVETHLGTFDFLDFNRRTKKLLEEKGAQVEYFEKEGRHIWGFWQKELPQALKYFFHP